MSELLVITGLSGAGGSTAATIFEDLGWFVIDNLPPALMTKVVELATKPGAETDRVALVVWTSPFLEELLPAIEDLEHSGAAVKVLFLEAADDVLIRRYEDKRRRHPLEASGVAESIQREREILGPVKARADVVVDTSDLNVHQLRERLEALFAPGDGAAMRTTVMSFGYKHGLPLDVDLVLDCRLLPNPHWVPELRPKTGLDPAVRGYVMSQPLTADFLDAIARLLDVSLPGYVAEGKAYLTIALGCTGGHHRSVTLAEEVAGMLRERGFAPTVIHRDVDRP